MKIVMIWGREDDMHWLIDAWDDDSIADNYDEWMKVVNKAKDQHGADNVRIVEAAIDMDAVVDAFEPAQSTFGPVKAVDTED